MKDLTIQIILCGPGGELDRQTVQIFEDCGETISSHVIEALKAWTLAPGDIITIEEVD